MKNSTQLSCSLCRNLWIVPPEDLCNLPKNFIVTDFINSISSATQCGNTDDDEQHDVVKLCNTELKTIDKYLQKFIELNKDIEICIKQLLST